MDATPYLEAASRTYRASLKTLALLIVLSAAVYGWLSPTAGLATLAGGMIAWLPHLLMVSRVYGITRRGVKPVTLASLMRAEAMKLILTMILFGLAFYWMPDDKAGAMAPWLFAGFIITLAANLIGLGRMLARMDAERLAELKRLKDSGEQDANRATGH